jgi:Ferritin-like
VGLLSGNRHLRLGAGAAERRPAWADATRVLRRTVDEEISLAAEIVPDQELSPRQHLIMLLQAAAEIEHALMVQYLFAAYSLRPDVQIPNASAGRTTTQWREELLEIAKEEMGHLLCVQNCLRAVGGANHFGRDNFPIQTGVYPFPFMLEPLSLKSVALYVAAEMPEPRNVPSAILTPAQLARIAALSGAHVNRVGVLFALIKQAIERLPDGAIRLDRDD